MSQSMFLDPCNPNAPNTAGAMGHPATSLGTNFPSYMPPPMPQSNWNKIPVDMPLAPWWNAFHDSPTMTNLVRNALWDSQNIFLEHILPIKQTDSTDYKFVTVEIGSSRAQPTDPRGPLRTPEIRRTVINGVLRYFGLALQWHWSDLRTEEGCRVALAQINARVADLMFTMAMEGLTRIQEIGFEELADKINLNRLEPQDVYRCILKEAKEWAAAQTTSRVWQKMTWDMMESLKSDYVTVSGEAGLTADTPMAFLVDKAARRLELDKRETTEYDIAGPAIMKATLESNPYKSEKINGVHHIIYSGRDGSSNQLGTMQSERIIGTYVCNPCNRDPSSFAGFKSSHMAFVVYDEDHDKKFTVTLMDLLEHCEHFWGHDGNEENNETWKKFVNDFMKDKMLDKYPFAKRYANEWDSIKRMGEMLETGAADPVHFAKVAHSILHSAFGDRYKKVIRPNTLDDERDVVLLVNFMQILGCQNFETVWNADDTDVRWKNAIGNSNCSLSDVSSNPTIQKIATGYAQVAFTKENVAAAIENDVFCMVQFLYVRPEAAYVTSQVIMLPWGGLAGATFVNGLETVTYNHPSEKILRMDIKFNFASHVNQKYVAIKPNLFCSKYLGGNGTTWFSQSNYAPPTSYFDVFNENRNKGMSTIRPSAMSMMVPLTENIDPTLISLTGTLSEGMPYQDNAQFSFKTQPYYDFLYRFTERRSRTGGSPSSRGVQTTPNVICFSGNHWVHDDANPSAGLTKPIPGKGHWKMEHTYPGCAAARVGERQFNTPQ